MIGVHGGEQLLIYRAETNICLFYFCLLCEISFQKEGSRRDGTNGTIYWCLLNCSIFVPRGKIWSRGGANPLSGAGSRDAPGLT